MRKQIEVITVDTGNTSIKSSEVVNGTLINSQKWNSMDDLVNGYPDLPIVVSSVNKSHLEALKDKRCSSRILLLDHQVKIPIKIDYDTPETLGADRIAAAVGAHHLFPNQNNIIIDLGTCLTIDSIDKQGIYHGGSISPGLIMRMQSMARYTANLPDISHEWKTIGEYLLGKTTKQSLFNGSFKGLLYEINGAVETLKENMASCNVILSGGDAHFFESRIKAHIFAVSKIVEIGLYRIWKYQ